MGALGKHDGYYVRMATDQERQELQRAITGGWSLTRSCALALGLLRAANVLRERRELNATLISVLPFYSFTEDQKSATSLLRDAGLASEEPEGYKFSGYEVPAGDITEEGWSVLGGLTALNVPAHISPASRELLLHALYRAGESGFVLRDAYFGERTSKSNARYTSPYFEPWITFAGDVVSLERFENALEFLITNGLAGRASRKSHKITEKGRALIEASPRTTWPGYLQASLQTTERPKMGQPETLSKEGSSDPQPGVGHATGGQPTHRVTYVIHGNVSNLVGNAGNSKVYIANGIDIAALMAATEQLRELLPVLRMPRADNEESAAVIDSILAEAAKSSPDRGRVRDAIQRLKQLIVRTQAPLTEIAIGVIDEQLRHLTG
jgi:hypothetical protein